MLRTEQQGIVWGIIAIHRITHPVDGFEELDRTEKQPIARRALPLIGGLAERERGFAGARHEQPPFKVNVIVHRLTMIDWQSRGKALRSCMQGKQEHADCRKHDAGIFRTAVRWHRPTSVRTTGLLLCNHVFFA